MAVKGVEKIDGREAYVLETHPGSPTTERIYVDRQSGLLVRDQVMPKVVFMFSDYRIVDGVEILFTVIQTTPNEDLTYTYQFLRQSA